MLQRIIDWFFRTIGTDRLLHFLVCAVIVFTFAQFAPIGVGILVAAILGIAKEVYDAEFGGGADLIDLIADIIGILYATICCIL